MTKIKPPYLPFLTINRIVEDLRGQFKTLSCLPVKIEDFTEFDLDIEIIPELEIRKTIGADAYITRNFKSIIIDYGYFNNPRMTGRNRFTIAHEIGHRILHKDFYLSQCPINSKQEWYEVTQNFNTTVQFFLEWQAETFASLLLMPLDDMMQSIENHETMETMSRKFNVSTKAVISRVKKDDIREKFADIMP